MFLFECAVEAEQYFGLSMFGIVGALTVLILCMFAAAAVFARVSLPLW